MNTEYIDDLSKEIQDQINREKEKKNNIRETLINLNQDRKSKTSPLYPTEGKAGEILVDSIYNAIAEFISMMEWQEDNDKFPTTGQKSNELQVLLSHGEKYQKLLNELSRSSMLELIMSIDPSSIKNTVKEVDKINDATTRALERLNELAAPGRPPEIARDQFILTMFKIYHSTTKRKPTAPNMTVHKGNLKEVFQGHCFVFIENFLTMATDQLPHSYEGQLPRKHNVKNPTLRTAYMNALKTYISDNQLKAHRKTI